MADSAWFLGAQTIALQSFTVSGNAASVAAGTYYIDHTSSALSLVRQVDQAIEAAVGGVSATVEFTRSRRIRIVLDVAQSITWGTATILRDLLGFTGNLGAGTTHLAPNVSPLLWSPGYLATPKTIAGVEGYSVDHKSRYKSDDGSRSETEFYGEETWQELSWTHIVPERLRILGTTAAQGGTFHQFYEQCAKLGYPFHHAESIDELDSDTSTGVALATTLGPYKLRGDTGDWYRRNQPNAELSSPLELELQIVDEVA